MACLHRLYALAGSMWSWTHSQTRNAVLGVIQTSNTECEVVAKMPLAQQRAVLKRMGGARCSACLVLLDNYEYRVTLTFRSEKRCRLVCSGSRQAEVTPPLYTVRTCLVSLSRCMLIPRPFADAGSAQLSMHKRGCCCCRMFRRAPYGSVTGARAPLHW